MRSDRNFETRASGSLDRQTLANSAYCMGHINETN